MDGDTMWGLSWTTQRKLAQLGEVPEQRIKLEGEAKAHLVEYPGPKKYLPCGSRGVSYNAILVA